MGAREGEDAKTLGAAVALVPATWLLLGWTWPDLVSGYDGSANVVPVLDELVRAGGDWSRLLYLPELLGGTKVRDAVGPLPVAAVLARAGFSAGAVLNLTTFAVQILIAFLGVRTATDLAAAWSPASRLGWAHRLAGIWACAFAPVLGWRVGYGHLTLLIGTLPFLATLALIAAAGAGTVSVVLIAAAGAAIVNGLLFTGGQMVLYGVIFGGPILLGLWLSGRRRRALALPAAVLTGSLLLAFPAFWGMLAHALSTDSLRTLRGMNLTYSYFTARPLDWLGSLAWTRLSIAPGRDPILGHEINNPAGPLLLLVLALAPWRRARALGVGLALSVGLALVLSMDVHPFSDWLLLVPPLGSFRAPTRAILPALQLMPVLALAAVLALEERPRFRPVLVAAAGAALLFVLPPLLREAGGWLLAGAVVLGAAHHGPGVRLRPPTVVLPGTVALLVLAAGGLAAFRERLLPFPQGDMLLARARQIGDAARRAEPRLASPLVRVQPDFEWPELLANTTLAAGLSGLDGYSFPQKRFVELVSALRYQPYLPNSLLLRFSPTHTSSLPLYQLYNVAWRVDVDGSVRPHGPTAGPAWFSAGFVRTGSFGELAEALHNQGDQLFRAAARTAWLMVADPKVQAARLPDSVDPTCGTAEVLDVGWEGNGTRARVHAPADCPLTVSMNYAETLRATVALEGGISQPAQVFPAYGALAGVWVPRGATLVRLEAMPVIPRFADAWRSLGWAVLVGAVAAVALIQRARDGSEGS